jgi:hypothetical protein
MRIMCWLEAQLVPEVNALWALTVAGRFAHPLRFSLKPRRKVVAQ